MPPDDQGERSEAPTQHRRDEARQRGQVAHSQDLTSAAILLGALVALQFLGRHMFARLANVMGQLLSPTDGPAWDLHAAGQTLAITAWSVGAILVPLMLTVMLLGVLGNLVQVGWVLTAEPLKPTFNKISPLAGLGRMFSKRSLVRLTMSLGKVGIIGVISWVTVEKDLPMILSSAGMDDLQVVALAGDLTLTLGLRVGAVLLALALLDLLYQRWQHDQDLHMTRQELKEDLKRMEGDPHIRARRQRVARQLAMQRMSQEVPRATVVVTNPTHLAVALLYREGMNAPKVVAKGADHMAIRIRQIGAAHGVPIVERKPLAQALYKGCKVGDEVPTALYKAVAEVLAYVYELARSKKIGRRIPASV